LKRADISKSRLKELSSGLSETRNLTEWLAVDQSSLLDSVARELKQDFYSSIAKQLPPTTVPKQIAWIGAQVAARVNIDGLALHPSDLVRCWAAYALGGIAENLKVALEVIRPFALDRHFGVREIAWMAVREKICEEPILALSLLEKWTAEGDANLRRFSTEATRPRGVWAKHIHHLKLDPSPATRLLSKLKSDPSRYVQDSVANWLNDAAKDHPIWVKELTSTWQKSSKSAETDYIIKRALRSLK
jgi:3-methyladenine DNA glycosylase AlkC